MSRRTARGLQAFGAAGLVIAAGLAVVGLVVAGPFVGALAEFEDRRAELAQAVSAASGAVDATAVAATDAGTSLGDGETALRDAAAVTGQLADATAGLAVISGSFGETSSRSRALSDELTRTADALRRNEADSEAAAGQLRILAVSLQDLSDSLAQPAPGMPMGSWRLALALLVLLVAALLGWLGVAAVACFVIGRRAIGTAT